MVEMPSAHKQGRSIRLAGEVNMRLILGLWLGLLVGILIGPNPSNAQTDTALAHTERTFEFIAFAPMSRVAPLFGAARERDWSPDWNPMFVWPGAAGDREGMVFTVAHGHRQAVWVNTQYDPEHGRFQYVYVLPDVVATLLTLTLTPREAHTIVRVRYERTALSPDASSIVQEMAQHDDRAAPEWEQQINAYLKSSSRSAL
jgi:hypothetical protein